jgi:hypothetical protein
MLCFLMISTSYIYRNLHITSKMTIQILVFQKKNQKIFCKYNIYNQI